MNAFKLLPNYTYDDYCQWEGRWEVIEGLAISMSPMPSPKHQKIAGIVHSFLLNQLGKNNCDCSVYQPIDIKIEENTVVCPDLIVACKPIDKNFLDFPPDLVVEILSPSTKLKDQNTKFSLYEKFGIDYYIMIDPDAESTEIYKLIDRKYLLISSDVIELSNGCKIDCDFNSIFD